MLLNWLPDALNSFLIGNSPSKISYIGFGTGTTTETLSDTALASEVGVRQSITISQTDRLLNMSAATGKSDTTIYGHTIKESGLFDALTSGNQFERAVQSTGLALTEDISLSVKKRTYIDSDVPVLDYFASTVAGWFTTTVNPPTHIGFGVNYTLDRCESSSAWTASSATAGNVNTTNFQEGSSSFMIGTSDASSAVFSYSQTLGTAIDLSDADSFIIWINIDNSTDYDKLATTGALKIYLGNDSSNYYLLTLDKSELYVGWQRIEATLWTDFTETGGVTTSAIDYLKIEFTKADATSTITSGNILMDYWNSTHIITADDTALASAIGSRLATTNSYVGNISRFVAVLDSSTLNGYKIAEVGLYNASSGGNLYIYDKSINLLKSSTSQIRQEFKLQVKVNE